MVSVLDRVLFPVKGLINIRIWQIPIAAYYTYEFSLNCHETLYFKGKSIMTFPSIKSELTVADLQSALNTIESSLRI